MDFENKIIRMAKSIPSTLKIAFISTFAFGLCAHMFMYTNPIFVGDSIGIYQNVYQTSVFMGGRWLGILLQMLMGGLSLPWLIGLISLSLMAFSAYYLCKVIDVKRKVPVVIVSALMVTYPSITASHAYISSLLVYAASLFFSILAAYHIKKKNKAGYALGILFIILSLGCYQAYISLTACLMVLFTLRKLLSENTFSFKLWLDIIIMIIVFVVAILIYYYGTVFVNSIFGLGFGASGYSGQENIGNYGSIGIGSLLKNTYILPFKYYLDLPYPTYLPLLILIPFWIGMFAAIAYTIIALSKKHPLRIWRIITIVGVSLFLPLTMNFVNLLDIGQRAYPHALMTFAFISPWLLMIMINEISGEAIDKDNTQTSRKTFRQWVSWLLLVPSLIFSLFGCYIANVSYLKMNTNYESGIAIINRVVTRIEDTPGYIPGETTVILIGLPSSNVFGYDVKGGFDITENITGVEETPFWSFHTVTNYIEQELQTEMKFGSIQPYRDMEEVQDMGNYPSQESFRWIDDVLVVKLN